jgi:hypothetical protein
MRRVGVALLTALALSTPVFAQSSDSPVSLNAAIGPSFANLGTTFSTTAGVDYKLNDRATVVGEFGAPGRLFAPAAHFSSDDRRPERLLRTTGCRQDTANAAPQISLSRPAAYL